jgi:hypothetical protein
MLKTGKENCLFQGVFVSECDAWPRLLRESRGRLPIEAHGARAEIRALDWEPRAGDWRAFVMNADGSRGITTELQFGARTSLLWWTGAALLGAAIFGVAAAGVPYALTLWNEDGGAEAPERTG